MISTKKIFSYVLSDGALNLLSIIMLYCIYSSNITFNCIKMKRRENILQAFFNSLLVLALSFCGIKNRWSIMGSLKRSSEI